MKKVLAIDMGATSIRGIVGYVQDGQLKYQEVMRMSHKIIKENGQTKWEWEKLLNKISDTIEEQAEGIASVGIDTWGVDFGLLDEQGDLIGTPLSYRDERHGLGHQLALEKMSEEDIFLNTGNQVMNINTLYQVLSYRHHYPENWQKAKHILMMPDLFQYMFTGEKVGEETIWSTSQILDLKTADYSQQILEKMELDKSLFPRAIKAGQITGNTRNAKLENLRKYDIDVISVCGHDTASAVLVTESFKNQDTMFLSCGTWSLVGGVFDEVTLTREAYQKTLNNELGYGSKAMLLKNITGLYLFEKLKTQLQEELGREISFAEITEYVSAAGDSKWLIDMDNEIFGREDVSVKEAINSYLQEKGQTLPSNDLDYFHIVYNSLVQKYLETKEAIEQITGCTFKKVHMIGGGAKSAYLCQKIADKLAMPVVAGPFEATALGNILIQLKTIGEIESIEQGMDLLQKTETLKQYQPNL